MTIEEIRKSKKLLLTCNDVAGALGIDPQGLRAYAHEHPERLGFPVLVYGKSGKQVRIPRKLFLRFLDGN